MPDSDQLNSTLPLPTSPLLSCVCQVCTCQSRLLIQEDIYDKFMERVVARTEAIKTGDPMDPETMMGAQVSLAQHDRIVEYVRATDAHGRRLAPPTALRSWQLSASV